jgi:hypothetical protein
MDGTFIAGSHKDLVNAQMVPVVHISDCRNLPYAPILPSFTGAPAQHSRIFSLPSPATRIGTLPACSAHLPDGFSQDRCGGGDYGGIDDFVHLALHCP